MNQPVIRERARETENEKKGKKVSNKTNITRIKEIEKEKEL